MQMSKQDMLRAAIFAKMSGGDVTVVDPDGEVLFVVGLEAGVHPGAKLAKFMTNGDTATLGKGLMTLVRGHKASANKHPLGTDIGANQEFKPERMSDFEKEMRFKMRKLQEKSDAAERMLNAAKKNAADDVKAKAEPEVIEEAAPVEAVEANAETPQEGKPAQ